MNPMQLLTASKSLMDIKEATGRYRMTEGLLPKFNSNARTIPPASTRKTEPITPSPVSQIQAPPMTKWEAKPKILPVKSLLIGTREIFLKSGISILAVCGKASASVTSALKKINPLSYWGRRRCQGKPENARLIKAAVQGELSLDKVKVVRNDLSDTDLEIIPVHNREKPDAPQQVPMQVSGREPMAKSWGRLASRIFGSEQTPI
ncbi:MAG: hypothetical protein HY298_01990 [Verrucomicrobia bacterium]|nr:hypothetical protein [Verrucomicrobiota bacterium]